MKLRSRIPKFWLSLAIVLLLLSAGMYLIVGLNVVRSVYDAVQFQPMTKPYRAKVVGFEERYGRYTTHAPIVEVQLQNEPAFRFKSPRYSLRKPFFVGEPVKLVWRPAKNFLGEYIPQYEIDSAWHLWIGDLLLILLLPAAIVAALLWERYFSKRRPGSYTLPP